MNVLDATNAGAPREVRPKEGMRDGTLDAQRWRAELERAQQPGRGNGGAPRAAQAAAPSPAPVQQAAAPAVPRNEAMVLARDGRHAAGGAHAGRAGFNDKGADHGAGTVPRATGQAADAAQGPIGALPIDAASSVLPRSVAANAAAVATTGPAPNTEPASAPRPAAAWSPPPEWPAQATHVHVEGTRIGVVLRDPRLDATRRAELREQLLERCAADGLELVELIVNGEPVIARDPAEE